MLTMANPIKPASSPCFQQAAIRQPPKRGGRSTVGSSALSFATRPCKHSKAVYLAPPLAGAGCMDSCWFESAHPMMATLTRAPWSCMTGRHVDPDPHIARRLDVVSEELVPFIGTTTKVGRSL